MRILVAHNFYQQAGGEDAVFEAECRLLESRGHSVSRFVVHNDRIREMGRLALVGATVFNRQIRRELRDRVREQRIEVVHFHNTFPLISPAAYGGARAAGAAVVQTLHNYRLLCPNALLFRGGSACTACVGKHFAWPAVAHRCYRHSRAASATVAAMLAAHRTAGTWRKDVDLFVVPSEFARRKFCEAGVGENRIVVKPHFVDPDPGSGTGEGGYAMFLGRLSEEKGIDTLLRAWRLLGDGPPLWIVGDGPLAPLVRSAQSGRIRWLGRQPAETACDLLGRAACLIVPSPCYETFGRVVAEAFAGGTPVIASDGGAPAEMVETGRTGLLFRAGDEADLARQVRQFLADDPCRRMRMRAEARREFQEKYNADANYERLLRLYRRAIAARTGQEVPHVHHDELGRWQPA